jgi:hypothetical protein
MSSQLKYCCEQLVKQLENQELGLVYISKFREFGIRYFDGGSSFQEIQFCPWCGCKLPPSLRDDWFDKIEMLGFDLGDEGIPAQMNTDEWWRNENI